MTFCGKFGGLAEYDLFLLQDHMVKTFTTHMLDKDFSYPHRPQCTKSAVSKKHVLEKNIDLTFLTFLTNLLYDQVSVSTGGDAIINR